MDYSKLVGLYEELEKTSARLKKIEAVANILKETKTEILPKVTLLLQGRVFPSWSEKEIGIASKMAAKIIAISTGFPEKDVSRLFRKKGDFGLVAEELTEKRKQRTLFKKHLTVDIVFENLQRLASIEGKGSQDRKFKLVSELMAAAKPKEAKYIIRTVIGDLRIGVAHGILRDAIARAFLSKEDTKAAVSAVEWAWFLMPDYGEIATIAKNKGIKGIRAVSLELGKPYHVLLAERSKGLEEAIEKFERPVFEYKYDGARVIIHKKGSEIWLFTRRLENITKQFPELVELARKHIEPDDCIVEGEIIAKNKKSGKPMPFQILSQRIKRKYNIEKMVKEIPIEVNLFDIVYLNGEVFFDKPMEFRRKILEESVKESKGKFQLAKQLRTKDIKKIKKFYQEALDASQEGLMVKNLDAKYQPGRRVGYWLKVKPVMENLDLVIIGATWGTGKRTGWFGSFMLGCRSGDDFLECGMIGTGIKEKSKEGVTFKKLTKLLKPHIENQKGNQVSIKPKIVVEVAYEEIQKSPNYGSGFALRFPRVICMRPDKGIDEVDSTKKIARLYKQQRGTRF